jgi:hypothetical protein
MRKWVTGLVVAAGALAALPATAAAQVDPTPPMACEQGQFTAADGAFNRDNFIQFVVHDRKAAQCQFDVPPDFHIPH